MENYNYASFARKLVAGIAMINIALVVVVGYGSAEAKCGTTAPVDTVPCPDYAGCVANVTAALQDVTPNTVGFSYTTAFPPGTFGGVKGSASCFPPAATDQEHCRECLVRAKSKLDDCESASGSSGNDVCAMSFDQLLPGE